MQRRPEPLQPVPPPGAAQGALREAEADQRLRARHGHVRHHRHGARERALVRRGLHQGECVRAWVQCQRVVLRELIRGNEQRFHILWENGGRAAD